MIVRTCEGQGRPHVRCRCGCEYCSLYWASCPRCFEDKRGHQALRENLTPEARRATVGDEGRRAGYRGADADQNPYAGTDPGAAAEWEVGRVAGGELARADRIDRAAEACR